MPIGPLRCVLKVLLNPSSSRYNYEYSKVTVPEDSALVERIVARLAARCPHLSASQASLMPESTGGAEQSELLDQMEDEGTGDEDEEA